MARTIILAMLKCCLAPILLLAPLLVFATPIWQWSESHQIQLTIRDKNPSGNYTVTFVVIEPDGNKESVTKQVVGDYSSSVLYPADFATDLKPGKYKWVGCVNGVAAVGGQFTYAVKAGTVSLTSSFNRGGPKGKWLC